MKNRAERKPRDPKPEEWLASDLSQQYIADYKPYNFVDGEGVRCSLYVSGCKFACPGCYNKVAQNFHYGTPYTQELEDLIIEDLGGADYCQGLTLLEESLSLIHKSACDLLSGCVRSTVIQKMSGLGLDINGMSY